MYLLDTNIVSYWMRGEAAMLEHLEAHAPSELSLSTITLAEVLYGIEQSPARKRERRARLQQITAVLELHPFDEAAAGHYAVVRAQLERTGSAISERDTQIAAIALARRLTVVTHNVREFRRVERLAVVDWA